jgi:tetratricopeptide (TPR) repeat protein
MVKFGPQDHEYDKVLQRLLGLARRALVVPWRHAQHRHMDSHSSILVRRRLSDLQKTDGESQGVTDGMKETKSKICYHIPLTKNNRFTGRIAILNTLEEMLFTKESNRRAALVGLGGVGKTQIALHFAYQLKERQPDYSIFWVPLLSEQSATQAYMEIAKKLNLPKSNNNEDERDLVRRYLNSGMAGKWLLIVDNADNQELIFGAANKPGIEAYLPESDNGIVLLTTRSGQVGVDFAGSDVIEVEQMDPEEALHLFKRSLIRKQLLEDEALIKELLLCLTFLPLAITQAVAYLNQTRAPVQAYLKLLQGAEEDMAKLLGREFRDHTRYRDSRNAVGTTWLVSFDQIERSAPGTVHLLSFISCIEPKAIPRTILPQGDQEELEWAIGTLCSYSFLVRQNDSNTFDMHSLVHMATRGWLEMRGCKNIALNDTICHVAKIFPSSDSANRDLWREYLPHAMHLLYQVDEHKINDAYSLFHKVGKCLFADRQFKEAIRCYEKEYRWRRDRYSEDNKERLDSEIELATAYLNDHRLREAIEMFEHIVAVQKETLDEGDYNRLGSEHELARAYLNDRRIKEAIKIFEHIVTVHKKTLDEKNYGRLASERELARAYLDDRRIKEAIKIFEHVMAIRKGILDEKDYKRLTSEHELARAYLNDRRIKEAIKILEHVVAVGKETLDERDYSRLASEHELARAYLDDRQIEEAIKMLEPIVAIGKKTLAKSNQIRLATEFTLARAYLDNRRITMATHILEHVVAVGKETFDKKDHIRLMFEHELARAYLDNQQNKEAIKMLEYIVVFRKEMLDERDYHRLVSEHELARAYLNNHQVKEAIKILEHIVPIGKETLNERDHIRLALEHTLARAYLDNRRIKEAIQILKHVVAIRKETLVERDYSRLTSERMLARAYLDGGDNERAIILLEHVVKIEPELLTDSDPERQLSSSLLADAQERLKSKELRE